MINAKLQNLYNIKNDIGTAIVNKGGTITESTPFYSYAGQIDNISTGTPQTVFQDSTGAKWAFTNTVNLTNDSGNVTSDFNWWQPANGATSDPILTGGTVGVNISGNVRIVPINQVYGNEITNLVITDTTGAKYVAYNGYDSQTNPNAPGTVDGSNIISDNQANMPFIDNTANLGGTIYSSTINNGYIYVASGASGSRTVQKFHESNLGFVGNTATYAGFIRSVVANNGFLYIAGQDRRIIDKYYEGNLTFVGNSASIGQDIFALAVNDGNLYAGFYQNVRKFNEGNLQAVANSGDYGGSIYTLTINNGYVYAGGQSNQRIWQLYESNLATATTSDVFGGSILSLTINNGYIYAGGEIRPFKKYYENNLVYIGDSPNYTGFTYSLTTNNGYIYAGGFGFSSQHYVQKFREDNLALVGSTVSYNGPIETISLNNGYFFVGGQTANNVQKFQESEVVFEQLPAYTFNRWLLNNSASGTVVFANATFTTGIYNGPNFSTATNESNLSFVGSASYGSFLWSISINNGFIYLSGTNGTNGVHARGSTVKKYHESNLAFVGNTPSFNGYINATVINNGILYVAGERGTTLPGIRKYNESTLTELSGVASFPFNTYGITTMEINNGFIYVGSFGANESFDRVRKFDESTLSETGSTGFNFGGTIETIKINNGFIYVGGSMTNGSGLLNRGIGKYNESTLGLVGNTANFGGVIRSVTTNNGFVYVGGGNLHVKKYHESNLTFVGNTAAYGAQIYSVTTNGGFIYVAGEGNATANRDVKKYYESNLAFVGNTAAYGGTIYNIATNSGFVYTVGDGPNSVNKYLQAQTIISPDNQTFYIATKIKEDI
jgi:hypothetical protein